MQIIYRIFTKNTVKNYVKNWMFYPVNIVPDTIIIFLEHEGEQGFQVDTMTMLPNPAITQLTSQAGLYHISTNLEIQRVAEQLYFHNCETEAKSIKNFIVQLGPKDQSEH